MGADALGERGLRTEKVGAKAAKKLLEVLNSEAIVDSHLADNLVPLLALVGGEIKADKITGHIRSNIYVCEKFLDIKSLINEEKTRLQLCELPFKKNKTKEELETIKISHRFTRKKDCYDIFLWKGLG